MLRALLGYSTCLLTRAAIEAQGFRVISCDLRASDHPDHYQGDIADILNEPWDFAVLHPMCPYLTCSAAWAYYDPDYERYPGVGYHQKVKPSTLTGALRRAARVAEIENFKRLDALPFPKVIENPAPSFISKAHRPPDQTVQPYQFGDDASKRTGLWVSGVPLLKPTGYAPPRLVTYQGRLVERWSNQTDSGQNRVSPSADRWIERSVTYPGIAAAIGAQMAGYIAARAA